MNKNEPNKTLKQDPINYRLIRKMTGQWIHIIRYFTISMSDKIHVTLSEKQKIKAVCSLNTNSDVLTFCSMV